MKYLIYSIEDDKDIAHIINVTLQKQGYEVKTFYEAKTFYEELATRKPDMILLDMMLPVVSGQTILKDLRSKSIYDDVDIIIISANHMVIDKIDGLDLGADDYIEKPFDLLELMSRVNARFRRHNKSKVLEVSDIVLDTNAYKCLKGNDEIQLTNKEFEILTFLFQNRGKVLSREDILNKIWGIDALETRTVDMHVKSLRKKIGEEIIVTVYGVGYKVI